MSKEKIEKNIKEEKIDYTKVNETITLATKILRISLILGIALGAYVIIALMKQLEMFNIILKILKILTPVFIGLLIAWLLNPFVKWLQKYKIKRVFGVIIAYVLLIGAIALLLSTLIPTLYKEIASFAETIPTLFDTISKWIDKVIDNFSGIKSIDIESTKENLINNVEEFGNDLYLKLPQMIVDIIKNLISGIGTFIVGLVIGFFFLLGFDNVEENLIAFLPKKYRDNGRELMTNVNTSLRSFVTGQLFDALLVFIVSSIVFSIIGLKSPLLFGLFCGITNVIPYIGPYIGAVPAVIVGFAMNPTIGFLVVLAIVIIQFIEGNFIQAVIISKTTKLNPITIISGLLIFGYFFGILGMIVSTPIIATCKTIILFINQKTDWFKFIN